jgi:hypothetical protein
MISRHPFLDKTDQNTSRWSARLLLEVIWENWTGEHSVKTVL